MSLGACVAAVRGADGEIEIVDPRAHTFYRELKPISDRWDTDALAVSGLTREHLEANGTEPNLAMADFAAGSRRWGRTLRARHELGSRRH